MAYVTSVLIVSAFVFALKVSPGQRPYATNGVMLSEILHSCFCSHYSKTDVEVQLELGIGRTSFYKMKKQALGYLGFYFYEIVVPQAKDKRFKPSLGVEEE